MNDHEEAGHRPPAPTLAGTTRVFLAESLLIPTGLVTAAYLARRLGPEGYGIFTVLAAIIAWVEWSLTAVFARASVKLVADAHTWQPIGSTIVSVHLVASSAAACLLWALAGPVTGMLGKPAVTGTLRLFALDIPLFCLAQAHRNILVGLGAYAERAWVAAARWVSRLLLIVVFVEVGWSLDGAILGTIGASAVELLIARIFISPAFSAKGFARLPNLWSYAAPLVLSGLALRFYDRLDLVTLTALGASTREAGFYAAAQSLAILPGLFAGSFSPLVLSSLSRAIREGNNLEAQRLGRDALRCAVLLVPFAALVSGSASEIVTLVFGKAFEPAAGLLSWLIFAAAALVQLSISTAILTAAGYLTLTLAVTIPLPLSALVGYLTVIPIGGATGAAIVTLVSVVIISLVSLAVVHRNCQIFPPAGSIFRSTVVSGAAYAGTALWSTPGFLLGIKLLTLSLAVGLAYAALGEFSQVELRAFRTRLRRRESIS
jgi:O-antigen/teichoic acid export membrane protein